MKNLFTSGRVGRHAGGSECCIPVGDTPSHQQSQAVAFFCEYKLRFSVAGGRTQSQHSSPFNLVSPTSSALLFVIPFLISSPFLNRGLSNTLYSLAYPISLVWDGFPGESEVRDEFFVFSCRQIPYESLLT